MPKAQAPTYGIAAYGQKFRVIERTEEGHSILRTVDTRPEAVAFIEALAPNARKKS